MTNFLNGPGSCSALTAGRDVILKFLDCLQRESSYASLAVKDNLDNSGQLRRDSYLARLPQICESIAGEKISPPWIEEFWGHPVYKVKNVMPFNIDQELEPFL
jgi:hypothetical protein